MEKFEEFILDGVVFLSDGSKVSYDDFFDKFIEMLEENGMYFGGSIKHYEEGEDEPTCPTIDCFKGGANV